MYFFGVSTISFSNNIVHFVPTDPPQKLPQDSVVRVNSFIKQVHNDKMYNHYSNEMEHLLRLSFENFETKLDLIYLLLCLGFLISFIK